MSCRRATLCSASLTATFALLFGVTLALRAPAAVVHVDPLPALSAAEIAPKPSVALYRVKAGDSLYGIARRYYGTGRLWAEIARANAGLDSQRLAIGAEIRIPYLPAETISTAANRGQRESGSAEAPATPPVAPMAEGTGHLLDRLSLTREVLSYQGGWAASLGAAACRYVATLSRDHAGQVVADLYVQRGDTLVPAARDVARPDETGADLRLLTSDNAPRLLVLWRGGDPTRAPRESLLPLTPAD
ncbi:MAG: LysM peptidoglycan-binding domain-containing protein [Planctomycetes bacterium]|nr:LysM peptidoglycan-binding domain-containing protein [Planctomycetota bacterium]